MKKKNNFINKTIKGILITGIIILAVFLGVKKTDLKMAEALIKKGTGFGVSYIWRHRYPSIMWDGKKGESRNSFFHFFVRSSPLYRYPGSKKEDSKYADRKEADPSYKDYIENSRFYEEHSFLLYDGGEESGEGLFYKDTPALEENKSGILTCHSSHVWPVIGTTYLKEQLADYDFMMKHFYNIHTSATAGRDLMNAEKFLNTDMSLKGENHTPKILIYHTHSQEEYRDYGSGNPEATVVGIGDYLTELLAKKGYHVIHDTTVYDIKEGKLDRNRAYTYALDGITRILENNPSIEVVLDIHRDGVQENLHMVNKVNGKDVAPLMFFNGVSQTPDGPVSYLYNPYREENLAFSFQMQLNASAYFPDLTRKIYIKGLRYNQHLRGKSALIEVGAQTNTYQEALNAMEPLAEVLNMVLKGK